MKLEQAIKNGSVKLNIGSGIGANVKPDYVNIDCVDNPKLDMIADVRHLPIPDNTGDEAICEHVIEHLEFKDVLPALKEWRRVLKPGATLYLSCPNVVVCMEQFLKNKETRWSEWAIHIYGGQLYETDIHRSGFDLESLERYINLAGYKDIKIEEFGPVNRGLRVWCKA